MTNYARLRKQTDLITYVKLTFLMSKFLKEFKECIAGSEYKDIVNDIFKKLSNIYLETAFALKEADKIKIDKKDEDFLANYKKRLSLQKKAKVYLGNIQIIINFIAVLDYENFVSIFHFANDFEKIDTMINKWINSDKNRFL